MKFGSTVLLVLVAMTTDIRILNAFQSKTSMGSFRPLSQLSMVKDNVKSPKDDNKAMSFLRKIGKVGGTTDFTNAMGIDEGESGKTSGKLGKAIRKAKGAYQSCVSSGVIDDMSETFPFTCSGTQWSGVTDKLIGGVSSGTLVREEFEGRTANVLEAKVKLDNNAGFVQMVTDLALDPSVSSTVDASAFDGIELEVFYDGESEQESFNVHLKNDNCVRQLHSYRATFEIPKGEWTKIHLPWSDYVGHGWGAAESVFDTSTLRRLGVVAIGKQMDVKIALSSIGFYKDSN